MKASHLRCAALTLTVASTLVFSGCHKTGGGVAPAPAGTTPRQEVSAAVSALDDTAALSTTLSVDAPAAVQNKLRQQSPNVPPAVFDLLNRGRLVTVVSVDHGTLAQAEAAKHPQVNGEVSFDDGATPVVSLRVVNRALYLHASMAELSKLTGQNARLAVLAATASAPPAARKAATTIADGGWLTVSAGELHTLADQKSPIKLTTTSAEQKLPQQMLSTITSAATVTELQDGRQYRVQVPVQRVALDLVDQMRAQLPKESAATLPTDAQVKAKIAPARTLTATLTVQDGVLRKVSFDLASLLDTKQRAELALTGRELLVNLAFNPHAAKVTAPTDAVNVDALLAQMAGGLPH